jgi:hypothetical protein
MPSSSVTQGVSSHRGEWVPTWTVITTPPSFSERWAARVWSRRRQGSSAGILWLAYNVMAGMRHWKDGETGWLIADVVLFVLLASLTWERYAFGQLLERYDAELRDIQSRNKPA